MKVEWSRGTADTFASGYILVRGRIAREDGIEVMAYARLPRETPESEIEEKARPLLVAKFALGEWALFSGPDAELFQTVVRDGALYAADATAPLRRELLEVSL